MKKIILFLTILFLSSANSQTQYPPISPKWVFEPWVWEDATNTKDATLALIDGYLNRDIPASAVIIDSPWEWPGESISNNGYNTFLFDPSRYNQPKKFIQDLNNRGIHVILWITGVIDTGCHIYKNAKDNGYFVNNGATTTFWKGSGRASHIDFFNPNAVAYWRSLMNKVLDSISVDGWKVDESDYRIRELDPTNHTVNTYAGIKTQKQYSDAYYTEMYNYIKSKRGNSGMITARPFCKEKNTVPYWFAPIQVNAAGWVGDKEHTWTGLQLALNNIFISAKAGYATVGSDIGGYVDNTMAANKNLFIRWAQLGALLPIMENGGKTNDHHFPWLFDQQTDSVYRYFAKLHHQLVPYLYSYDIQAHSDAISIVRPIGADTNSWKNHWEYLLGNNFFVSAIYQDNGSQYSDSKNINFPAGKWINYWNEDDIHQGGTTATSNYNLNQYPIFIRSGAIIPMNVDDSAAETGHGSSSSKNYLTLLVYPDGVSSLDYHSDPTATTRITSEEQCGGIIISFNRNTDSVIIRLKNDVEPERVFLSGSLSLQKKNTFTEFELSSSGWFHGKLRDGENVYTWIKFTSPTDSVFVATSSVSDINPATYKLSKLNVGNEQYIDRTIKLSNIPDEYKGLNMIKTANNDKMTINLNFHFNVCSNTDIYIAYDHRLSSTTPSWITSSYTSTGKTITDNYTTPNIYDIWKRNVISGTVNLGDNNGVSNSSMYFVFYKLNEELSPPQCPAEMISYWKLDETSGSTYKDEQGINNGAASTRPVPVTGQVNGAQQFNGSSTKVNVSANPSFDFGANDPFSVEFWYKGKTMPAVRGALIGRWIQKTGAMWYLAIKSDGRAGFYMQCSGSEEGKVIGKYSIGDSKYHHIAAVKTSNTMSLFVDGVLQGSINKTFTSSFSSSADPINIGWFNGNLSYMLNGSLDEIAIYNKQLTPDEILHHYNNGLIHLGYCGQSGPGKQNISNLNSLFEQFNVLAENGCVKLYWRTSVDVTNGFEIERKSQFISSFDKEGAKKEWEKINFINSSNGTKNFEFTDNSLLTKGAYSYRIKLLNKDGSYAYSDEYQISFLPLEYKLFQNYPNPFNPVTIIKFSIPISQIVSIKIYNELGEEIIQLANQRYEKGIYEVEFNASALGLSSGVYFYRMESGSFISVKKLLLLK